MDTVTRVQILNKAIYIHIQNSTILPPTMGK